MQAQMTVAGPQGVDDELAQWLAQPAIPTDDPLAWWLANKSLFPHLARMAIDVHSIPGTHVSKTLFLVG